MQQPESLLARISRDRTAARMARDNAKISILTTLYSEAANVGLNDGKRESHDHEVVGTIKKFLKNLDEAIEASGDEVLIAERVVVNSYLPAQLTAEEITVIVQDTVDAAVLRLGLDGPSPKLMGEVMSTLKDHYRGRYDGKLASQITKGIINV